MPSPAPSTAPRTAIVVGAGIMGLSAAWALARAGVAVRVLDQDQVPNPRGSSHDDHRLIRHAYGAEAGYMRMIDPAYAAWDLLFEEAGTRPYVQTGVLALSNAPGGWLEASRAALCGDGHAVTDLSAGEVAARYPFLSAEGLADAFHLAPGGVLLASRILGALVDLLARRGIAVERARVAEVDPDRGTATLADGTRISADLLVVAAGPWALRLLPDRAATMRPARQVVVRLAPPDHAAAGWAAAPMLLDLAEDGGFYAVPPVAGTPLKIGDHRFGPTVDPDAPRDAAPEEVAAILDLARHRIRGLDGYRVLSAAACWYDVAPEERFAVEPIGTHGMVMTGFTGHGFKFGALLGLALARAAGDAALLPGLGAWAAGLAPPPSGLLSDLAREPMA